MLDVEVVGDPPGRAGPSSAEIRRLCEETAATAGVRDGHVAIEFVDAQRITELNAVHRGRPAPTDVLSFPIDGVERAGPNEVVRDGAEDTVTRELGDVVICPAHTSDLREAVVHGMLHLLGMDHETDDGEMLTLQRRLLRQARR